MLRITGVTADVTERPGGTPTPGTSPTPRRSALFWDRSSTPTNSSAGTPAEALEVVAAFLPGPADERNGAIGLYGWVGGAVSDVADDDTAYVHRRARLLVEMSSWWPTAAEPSLPVSPIPPEIQTWAQQLWRQVLLPTPPARAIRNFPDPELREWASAYYGDNLILAGRPQGGLGSRGRVQLFPGIPLPR